MLRQGLSVADSQHGFPDLFRVCLFRLVFCLSKEPTTPSQALNTAGFRERLYSCDLCAYQAESPTIVTKLYVLAFTEGSKRYRKSGVEGLITMRLVVTEINLPRGPP
jgi:hypothetical protein